MKEKTIGILFVCTMLMAVLLSGCAAKSANSTSGDKNIISISRSDETKEFEAEYVIDNGDKVSFEEGYIEEAIEYLSDRTEQILPECEIENSLELEECEGSKVYTIAKDGYDSVVLYIHGGAWIYEITAAHLSFCDDLATKLNAKVYIPLYPLAPQAKSDETYAMIESLYKEILKEEKKVYVMGDSAGGNLSLGLMYTMKDEGLTKPDKIVLLSPCTDLTFSNPDIKEYEKTDPTLASYGVSLCAKLWAGEENLKNAKNSAVYADVTGYPDTMLIQGTDEITYPDNMILYQKMVDAGVNVTLVEGENLWHVFPVYPIPERETTLDLIAEFCSR